MSWLPRLRGGEWTGCRHDGEIEGYCLWLIWRGYEIEIAFGRHNGRFR